MPSKADKISVTGDPRIQKCETILNGTKYGYLLSLPESGSYKGTVFLIHGFPDLSMGWRYQIPYLRSLGYRVVAPDMMGYGRTDAPAWTPSNEYKYSYKQAAADIKQLAHQLDSPRIILGGHDWGGAIVQRIALYHPSLVSHLFSICTPYLPVRTHFIDTQSIVTHPAGNGRSFGYQLQLESGDVEKRVRSRGELRQVLNALYGGWQQNAEEGGGGRWSFSVEEGILWDRYMSAERSKVLSEEELGYYVDEYSRHGIHGPLNYYRTRRINHALELPLLDRRINVPYLFIGATKDLVLNPSTWGNNEKYLAKLTTRTVASHHWVMWDKPEEVNGILGEWFAGVVEGGEAKL